MGAKLIRNGHTDLVNYRMGFFYEALVELADHISETRRYNALSHRLSKLEGDDFEKMMSEGQESKPTPVVDHEAQIRKMKGLN